jgi:DNA-binding NarL/FixJ family response regulator
VSEKTVEKHVASVFAKLGVSSRAEVAAAIERWRVG